ncbi:MULTISPECIES: hypothetical protein [Cryobacterium]|uniref:Uncharacterized protein n=1 Tax=Cryobacterium glucosi TaxID=1259175 RepID=A0ABY2IMQ9_9MICO|nr:MULTISPECIES: hypothetical protein [Cryobacterium]MDY7529925.1 hypothetical protein [Cryobacterium sp. 10C2]MDY7557940.1 hypothetical protein [Cryobacterium sp. 10C3]MEB0004451.1 hypothetical protein [Cryobacterium sp. RTC2.1]MEB0202588.1 hypothetical protein [Cryobacterium sp. 5I3]MEB0288547.1 hypothetical protein [Cryobacterium sp. 10S3]
MNTQPQDDTTPDEPSQAADAIDKAPTDSASEPKAPKERQPITTNRIVLWVIVAAIGIYFVGTGLYGILVK